MKKMMIPAFRRAAACCAIALSLSCVSTPGAVAPAPDTKYYDENAKAFTTMTLDNGIKLVLKKNDVNRILSLNVIVKGGSSAIPADMAGLESVGLSMLTHGSNTWSYEEIQAMLYAKSAAIGTSAGYDYGVYALSCIDKYFDSLFPVFASGFLEPAMDPQEFDKVLNDALQGAQQRLADPDSYARWLGSQAIFAGTSYESDPSGSPESLQSLSLGDVEDWYGTFADADRISIVAVGNYDAESLFSMLNSSFGKLPRKGGVNPPAAALQAAGPMVKEADAAAQGVLYLQGYFSIPGRADPDYVPFAIAMDMLDDAYFNIVRERHGACYSIGTVFRPAAASYGIVWVYQSTAPEKIKSYIDEAVALLSSGRLILMKDPATGDYVYSDIARRLDAYKAKYVNSVYGSQRTNGEVADSIARSLAYFEDPTEYLRVIEKIKATSAKDIERVLDKYILEGSFRWVAVSDSAILDSIPEASYPTKSFEGL